MAIPVGPPPPPFNPIVPFPTTGYYWATSYFDNFQPNWKVTGTALGVNVSYPSTTTLPKLVWRNSSDITFKKNKTYQIITQVGSFFNFGTSFSANTSWGDYIDFDQNDRKLFPVNLAPPSPGNGYLYFYSSPNTNTVSKDAVTYKANYRWGASFSASEKLFKSQIYEIEFDMIGFAWWRDGNSTSSTSLSLSASTDGKGWAYYDDTNSYIWFDDVSGTIEPAIRQEFIGNLVISKNSNTNLNCIYKYITTANFNLSFTYNKLQGQSTDGIDIYLSQEKPDNDFYQNLTTNNLIPQNAELIASYTQSGSTFSSYFGLRGNQYLIIKASASNTSTTIALSEINISGGYWSGNNRQYLTTDSGTYSNPISIEPDDLVGATFSTFIGTGNTYNATQSLDVQQLFSKIGNGRFMSGIWENGVWNSGWRLDENVYEFYTVGQYFSKDRGNVWRFEIIGPESSADAFSVGDKVSIGNIVAIDFNEKRKLLKRDFTVLLKTSNSIVVEIINNFPLNRIEKDSPNHRILITKNIWLSGVFLNGYYTGVWNNGLFKGYPLLTEMFDSHWIDGKFDGGHFKSNYHQTEFYNTYFRRNFVGLSFSQPHRLNVGDLVVVQVSKNFNRDYNGTASITSVPNEYEVLTDIIYLRAPSQSEPGSIFTSISSGVIQNFDFKSNNISSLSSNDYLDSEAVFLYNSWIDVNFYDYSAVNIGRPNTSRNNISLREYAVNNLYGYPTDDVLSSRSTFRNSYDIGEQTYNLGTKYKIYADFVGRASSFETYFYPTNVNPDRFLDEGWTFSQAGPDSIVFSSTVETRTGDVTILGQTYSWNNVRGSIVGSEMQIDAIASGGVLDVTEPKKVIDFRILEPIQRTRYSMVEFDLVRWAAPSEWYESNDSKQKVPGFPQFGQTEPNLLHPVLHFDNLNTTQRIVQLGTNSFFPTTFDAIYFPVYRNVNHLLTPVTKKVEYFYNKRNLSMNVRGSGFYGAGGTTSIILDNLKYYEVDMIPFFQYFTENNINFGIQIPFQGIAPFIDYTDLNFQFEDNVSIGFDSFSVNASAVAVSGVGVGIGLGFTPNTGGVVIGTGNVFQGPINFE